MGLISEDCRHTSNWPYIRSLPRPGLISEDCQTSLVDVQWCQQYRKTSSLLATAVVRSYHQKEAQSSHSAHNQSISCIVLYDSEILAYTAIYTLRFGRLEPTRAIGQRPQAYTAERRVPTISLAIAFALLIALDLFYFTKYTEYRHSKRYCS